MATIEKSVESVGMKITVNHGEREGKIVKSSKTYVDVDPWFCTEVCPAVIADQLVYSGKYHLTAEYARYLSGPIEEMMAPALTAPR